MVWLEQCWTSWCACSCFWQGTGVGGWGPPGSVHCYITRVAHLIVLKGLSVIWLEDCVVIRVCCKKKKKHLQLINILVVYFSCWECLASECDRDGQLNSLARREESQSRGQICHRRRPNSPPPLHCQWGVIVWPSVSGAKHLTHHSQGSEMKVDSPHIFPHVCSYQYHCFLSPSYVRLHWSKEKFSLLML